ncbi:MAG: 1-acyl-sn-glycerol-3-phosphate acyltransferase [Muribaculaceae bacterium]|nr:1-acyl-sn-glycerol-3-phosphate acyltransferase [Muribaculaceae bacterium]
MDKPSEKSLNDKNTGDQSVGPPDKPLVLNIREILRNRIPANKFKLIPSFLITSVEKLIRQDELNEILRITFPNRGSEFSKRVLKYLDISVDVKGFDLLPDNTRFMFASNHPLGGLDGITLIAILGQRYGDENIRFLVNDMLMNVEPLKDVFLPINKFGRQGRQASMEINEALASDKQILQFPAGLCSRLGNKGEIKDLEWQKSFVAKAIETKRDIVPLYFDGKNSSKFYKIAKWRKKSGIKFNLEQILLPSEVCKARGKHFNIRFGSPISWQDLKNSGKSPKELAAEIRDIVYSLKG